MDAPIAKVKGQRVANKRKTCTCPFLYSRFSQHHFFTHDYHPKSVFLTAQQNRRTRIILHQRQPWKRRRERLWDVSFGEPVATFTNVTPLHYHFTSGLPLHCPSKTLIKIWKVFFLNEMAATQTQEDHLKNLRNCLQLRRRAIPSHVPQFYRIIFVKSHCYGGYIFLLNERYTVGDRTSHMFCEQTRQKKVQTLLSCGE